MVIWLFGSLPMCLYWCASVSVYQCPSVPVCHCSSVLVCQFASVPAFPDFIFNVCGTVLGNEGNKKIKIPSKISLNIKASSLLILY